MAFVSPQILGVPGSGVRAKNPKNFLAGTTNISNMLVSEYSVGTAYLNQSTGVLYKLYQTDGTGRSWVIQDYSTGRVASFLTSDTNSATPSSGIITLAQGNGITTTSTGSTATIVMSGSYTGAFTYTGSADTMLNVVSSLSTAGTAGPVINLYRNKATASTSDVVGEIIFSSNNSTPAKKTYAQDFVTLTGVTASSEAASWTLQNQVAGTLTTQMVAASTGMQIRGNNTNTPSPSGFIGETVKVTIAQGSAIPLTTGSLNVFTLAVPAGNFLLSASLCVVGGTYTGSHPFIVAGYSPTSATFPAAGTESAQWFFYLGATVFDVVDSSVNIPPFFVSNATPTTYYVVTQSSYTGSATVYGSFQAIRIG